MFRLLRSPCSLILLAVPAIVLPVAAHAQQYMSARNLTESIQQHGSAGTSVEPASTPVPMLMSMPGKWMLMLHANAFAADTQQQARGGSGRGKDAFFSTNWIMPMAQRSFGADGRGGLLTLRAMLSAEPGTMKGRQYPELFQQGETAFGAPIIDGQHPHDFLMEVAALYDLKLSHNTLLSLYAAPVGDPAIGPTAYPHRQSASEDPIAALGHHQQDSTHIAFNVVTGGLTYRWARVELSGFHGAEPTEAHWHFQPSSNGRNIDSVATRISVAPGADWAAQYSIAHLASPEALYPGEDQQRQTASVMYHHTFRSRGAPATKAGMTGMDMSSGIPNSVAAGMDHSTMQHGSMPGMSMEDTSKPVQAEMNMPAMHTVPEPTLDFSSTAIWGRTRSLHGNGKQNSYLFEALLRFAESNYAWTRVENACRSNELLLTPGAALPPNFHEDPIGHVAAFTFGYDHDIALGKHVLAAPGMQFTTYRSPEGLGVAYGQHPSGEVFFVRFRVR